MSELTAARHAADELGHYASLTAAWMQSTRHQVSIGQISVKDAFESFPALPELSVAAATALAPIVPVVSSVSSARSRSSSLSGSDNAASLANELRAERMNYNDLQVGYA